MKASRQRAEQPDPFAATGVLQWQQPQFSAYWLLGWTRDGSNLNRQQVRIRVQRQATGAEGCINEQGPLRGHKKPHDTSLLWASTLHGQARSSACKLTSMSHVGVFAVATMPGLQDTLHRQCRTARKRQDMLAAAHEMHRSQPSPQLVVSPNTHPCMRCAGMCR